MLDMGMGKTVTTLTAIQELMYNYYDVQRVLVIAPLHVAQTTWLDEVNTWQHLHLKIMPVLGTLSNRISALNVNADIYIINRENLCWLVNYYGKDFPFDMVVIDESSSFKNPQSKRFKALRKVRPLIKRIVELTGTPAPNSLMDLWSQLYILDRGERLGRTLGEYRRLYFREGASNGRIIYNWKLLKDADKLIYKKISDICVSMSSKDYLELPPVISNVIKVTLPPKVLTEYSRFERDLIISIDDTKLVASSAGVLVNKLLQFANGAVYDSAGHVQEVHTAKLDALAEILDAVQSPVLIFYWYQHDLERLKKKFPLAAILKSAEDIKRWNAGQTAILLAHPASAGHGLNLQYGGHTIIWFSLTWSLELYQQANKRLHRIGQGQPVTIHHLVASETIDETVMDILGKKNVRQKDLLTALKARFQYQ